MNAQLNAKAASEAAVLLEKRNNCLRRQNAALVREILRLRAKLEPDTADYEVYGRRLVKVEPEPIDAKWTPV